MPAKISVNTDNIYNSIAKIKPSEIKFNNSDNRQKFSLSQMSVLKKTLRDNFATIDSRQEARGGTQPALNTALPEPRVRSASVNVLMKQNESEGMYESQEALQEDIDQGKGTFYRRSIDFEYVNRPRNQ